MCRTRGFMLVAFGAASPTLAQVAADPGGVGGGPGGGGGGAGAGAGVKKRYPALPYRPFQFPCVVSSRHKKLEAYRGGGYAGVGASATAEEVPLRPLCVRSVSI